MRDKIDKIYETLQY